MLESYAILCPAPVGSGDKYFFMGYFEPLYAKRNLIGFDHVKIYTNRSRFSISINDHIGGTDLIYFNRITPNVSRLRNHIFYMNVASYTEAKEIYDKLLEVGVAVDDDAWHMNLGGLDVVEKIISEKLDKGVDINEIYNSFNDYPALKYVMSYCG